MGGGNQQYPVLASILKGAQDMFLRKGGTLHGLSGSTILHHLPGWLEIYSPCFWTSTFALIHLVFITSILARSLFRVISWCRKIFKFAGSESNNNPLSEEQKYYDLKLGVSYRACMACCLFMLATHVLKIALFQLKSLSDCKCPYFLLAEGLQLVSWIILSIEVFGFKNAKSEKLPWIIRAWWIFYFLQSVSIMVFDIRSILPDHVYIQLRKCTDLLTLLISTYLFTISVRGKTGIAFDGSSMAEPLLGPTARQQMETKRQSFYGRASLLELITFSWMNPVFAIGYQRPLENNDMPDVDVKDSAEFMSDSFGKIIANVEHHGLTTSSVYKAMFLLIRRKAIINAGFAVLNAAASFVGPSLINDLVNFLGGDRHNGHRRGYLLAAAFLSAKVIEAVAQRQWIFGARQLGMQLRAALISQVYQKGLSLSWFRILHNIWLMYTDGDSSDSGNCFVRSCNIPDATGSNFPTS